MPNPTLFISYSSRSQLSVDLAHELAYSLRNDGYEVFLDKDDLPTGDSFDDRIGRAIEGSDGFIFLASPEALEPGAYTLTELNYAKRRWRTARGHVLPVLLGDARTEKLDPYLRVLNVLHPIGSARAEVLTEVRRIWPIATSAAPPGPIESYQASGPAKRRLVIVVLSAIAACIVGYFAYQEYGRRIQPPEVGTADSRPEEETAALNFREDCIPHDPAALELTRIDARWKIVDGNHWMFDFADNAGEAKAAFEVLMRFGFDEVCYIGRPAPSMVYMRKNGAVPGGDSSGLDCIAFDPGSTGLRVESGGWLLFSGRSAMATFPNETEARRALAVIGAYRLNRQCFVGRPDPSFKFWLSEP